MLLGNGMSIFSCYLVNKTFLRKTFVNNHEKITMVQPAVPYFLEDTLYELSNNNWITVNNCNANTFWKQLPAGVR